MAYRKKEDPRKGELTSMIDMIFLLLIFFLVTLAAGMKPQEEEKVGKPIKAKERVVVNDAISDTNFFLKISINQFINDSTNKMDQGNRFQIYLLDASFKDENKIDEEIPKEIAKIKKQLSVADLGATVRALLQQKMDSLQSYLPFPLPSRYLYENQRSVFDREYSSALKQIEQRIVVMKNQQNLQNPERIKIFLDMDRQVYYKFIVDMNDMYFRLKPNEALNLTSQDNLFINVLGKSQK